MRTARDEMIAEELEKLIQETFAETKGKYLDDGTTLLETARGIGYDQASRSFAGFDETIAGHINHCLFFLTVMKEYAAGERHGQTDWNESWKLKTVTETEWAKLQDELGDAYSSLVGYVRTIEEWDGAVFSIVVSILAHSAYHLGAIRQMINLL